MNAGQSNTSFSKQRHLHSAVYSRLNDAGLQISLRSVVTVSRGQQITKIAAALVLLL